MDPTLYRAAMEGHIDVLNYLTQFETQLTPNKNTVLHLTSLFGKSLCSTEILRNRPSLLLSLNSRGETPFHIAAREGHTETVRTLIEFAKTELRNWADDMLRLTNDNGDTALHEAVRFRKLEVVKLLVREDREFRHPWNKAEETPLYLAVEKGLEDIVCEILKYCESPSYIGPMRRTALHAAVIFDSQGCTTELLKWKPNLSSEMDIEGWAPIHLAARLGRLERIKQMLNADSSLAYLAQNNAFKRTAIHIAAIEGNVSMIQHLISRCPDCWESVDWKGQNILHFAMSNDNSDVIRYILGNPMLSSLINQNTFEGNTPLHLNTSRTSWNFLVLAADPRVERMSFNKENLTPFDIAIRDAQSHQDKHNAVLRLEAPTLGYRNEISFQMNSYMIRFRRPKLITDPRKAADTHMIVAALIVTITFTIGFTVPGGYNGNEGPKQGVAILAKKAAFKAFMISDTIALLLSTLALAMNFTASVYEKYAFHEFMEGAASLISFALGAMMVAFISGTYVMLQQQSLSLAIATCIASCCFFPVYFGVVRKLHRQLSVLAILVRQKSWLFLKPLVRCLLWAIFYVFPE